MGTTMNNFNNRGSVDGNYKAIDLSRDKFNKTTTSGFGNFQTVGQGQKRIIGSNPMTLPEVAINKGGNYTTMGNYAKVPTI
jgi:hypothetical protein